MVGFKGKEFSVYFLVGGIATLIDWTVFALSLLMLGPHHYLISLFISISCAGIFHYFTNKHFTFQCQSRAIYRQIPLYVGVSLVGLGMSLGMMRLLVGTVGITPLISRVLTTAFMVLPNYFMHKYLTFNKKIFTAPVSSV